MIEAIDASAPLLLAVIILAGYRVARLIVHDEILGSYPKTKHDENGEEYSEPGDRGTGLRRLVDIALLDEDGDPRGPLRSWLSKLLSCPVCTGVWADAALLAGWVNGGVPIRWGIVAAAIAGGQALLSTRINA